MGEFFTSPVCSVTSGRGDREEEGWFHTRGRCSIAAHPSIDRFQAEAYLLCQARHVV